MQKYNVKLV